ncbi:MULTISPECIES: aldehyde dehydrogenase [Rhizobium/Agrobacterium group]|uniref:aldehyde dehydrogenase n=1 Tax=Rhizobium/Agrobacterium group TaxID=227290 RepID=UPI00107F7DFA|nr:MULTISPECIES: aldehyde dehydrogenase [Rhizobium/Agrobacterium group]MBB4402757.1 benzaldehyde dehydrogenase (NAD) [Agrobacterium radiobacter]MBB5589332.1 benzaldehyde dehydrogenase (NAD) [Agrobacterium radiobacter]TGE85846.1 salicylaldehyde dehydrogenase [Rhizobium sp. SEMIA 4032]
MNVNLLIGDQDLLSSNGRTFDRTNPLSREVATTAPAATVEDADAAVSAAVAAYPAWSALGPNDRRMLLLKAAEVFEGMRDEFVRTMIAEIGTTDVWASFNVKLASGMLREAASLTTQIKGEVIPSDKPGCIATAVRQAAGVCLGIAPWNAPIILGVRAVATPLACGNTVILKASEICPGTHRLIGEVFREAGFPAGVVNVITNAPEDAPAIVERLIANPAVKRINFTGSTRVGRIIGELAGRHLKPVVLELGGKAPLIVLDDADLDAAVEAVAFGAFINQGQVCMSTERVIVDAAVADRFVEKLAAKATGLPAGDPRSGPVVIGSLVDEAPAKRVGDLIDDAISKGAKRVAGGERSGTVVPATVLDHVTDAMRIYSEESFGPVVSVIRAEGIDDAIRLANDSEYGLSAAVFGRDVARALTVARRIESGICHVNGPTVHDEAQMPFGGVKGSGFGRFGGQAGIAEFTELRWITIETEPQHYPF